MDRVDTARGRGGGLLVYAGEEIRILKEDKKVNFHQCCHFNVYDVSVCLKYRSPNAPPRSHERTGGSGQRCRKEHGVNW
jgi:hypothetical protein